MENTSWLKQAPDKPLFGDLIWSQPETKQARGKLLIVGGNSSGFVAPGSAYQSAVVAGVGSLRVLLPKPLQKTLGRTFTEAEFAPATPSGSFSRQALENALEAAQWADGVLLAGDFGRNSETSILLESLATVYKGPLCVAGDAIDYFQEKNNLLLGRLGTCWVINLGRLQKLAKNNRPSTPVLHSMDLQSLVSVLADWSNSNPSAFVTKHNDNLVCAYGGKVSTTPHKKDTNWQVELAAYATVWWLQNSAKPFEALTSAVFEYQKNGG